MTCFEPDAQGVLHLATPAGDAAQLSLAGGHLLGWQPANAGEQLYLSPRSSRTPGQAIRGGVPVIFPQFADTGTGPRHGFARTAMWAVVSAEQGKDDALAVLRLIEDDSTRRVWPQAYALELSVRLADRSLDIELACENLAPDAVRFTAALHSYLAVADLDAASVEGLSGLRYTDKVLQREDVQRAELLLPGEKGVLDLDRIYHQVSSPLALVEQLADGKTRRLEIRQEGFTDAVVWNPGPERCARLADMPADGWRRMLCIEAASVAQPVSLEPGETWVGRQSFVLV